MEDKNVMNLISPFEESGVYIKTGQKSHGPCLWLL